MLCDIQGTDIVLCYVYDIDPENKIDDDYIQRYLGPLGPTEENALIQVECLMCFVEGSTKIVQHLDLG